MSTDDENLTPEDTKRLEAHLRGQAAERAAAWEADRPDRERRLKITELKKALAELMKVDEEAERIRQEECVARDRARKKTKWAPFVGAVIESVTDTDTELWIHTDRGSMHFEGGYDEQGCRDVEVALLPKS